MPAIHPSMTDLYRRLEAAGLDRPFLRKAVFPEWWQDRLASNDANRELAELYVAKSLALRVADLRNPQAELTPLPVGTVRYKRSRNATDQNRLNASALIAERVGRILSTALSDLPEFNCCATPADARNWILARHGIVNLAGILDFCWAHGIVVFHLSNLPSRGYRIDGMATFCGNVPMIMLGSNRPSAWLAFHAAHELTHILERHVSPGSGLLVDSDLVSAPEDQQEHEADRGAMEIIAGAEEPEVCIPEQISPRNLAMAARRVGAQEVIDPGILCLIFGSRYRAWSLASAALNFLLRGEEDSASAIIQNVLRSRLDRNELSDSHARFLDTVLG
jgi:hypothetical protein